MSALLYAAHSTRMQMGRRKLATWRFYTCQFECVSVVEPRTAGRPTECECHSKHAILDRPFLTTSPSFLFFGKHFNHPRPLNLN